MNRLITVLNVFFGIILLSTSGVHAEIVAGRDYKILQNPQPTQNNERIEVIEFFWYGCPHCNSLHPHIKTWLKNKPDDVDFRYVPAIFRNNWIPGAKTFYTIVAMNELETMHDRVYDAIHRDKIDLSDESVLFNWIDRQGIDKDKFINIYQSFTIQNQVARTNQMMRQYQLTGVPAFVVEGQYLTSGKKGGTPQDTMQTLNAVIDMVRNTKTP
ncbi:thiol:disulfide interchange protein DsbA/DsbL [Nitrosomonas marina]|uniref:Thiol:disulfide interchange protein n=1 Tax=Nitrosomonas marina TaxID=917 RepID=A0A1H8BQ92_9PROT|nr:thiol:disulfide interchange protein DsbA/DsbL [Nitrosomonas marina]SEM85050.1 thiol:disulfide interchange protein DsbA [Nitrosomonas marina]